MNFILTRHFLIYKVGQKHILIALIIWFREKKVLLKIHSENS